MNPTRSAGISVTAYILCTGWICNVHGAGFQLFEQSVSGLGTSFASTAAAEDASTLWWNPAGMSYLSGTNLTFAGHIFRGTANFENQGSRTLLPPPNGLPLSGGNGGDAGGIALIPNFYLTRGLTDKLRVGVGVNSPFGLTTEYDDGWVGRYHALKSASLVVNVNPSIAWKINDALSVGAGANLQYAKAELSNAVDFSTICLGAAAATPGLGPLCDAAGLTLPGNPATDGKATVAGDNWAYGFNLGAIWQISASTRIGIAYRSSISQDLQGDVKYENVPAAFAGVTDLNAAFANTGAKASVDLPEIVSLGLNSQIDERWALMADVTWTNWSRFEELRVTFDNGASDSVTTENWDDSFRVAVGASYKRANAWTLRAGLAYDQSPVPDDFRTPRIPDQDRTWLSVGANWKITRDGSLDFGYAHIFVKSASIDQPASRAENNGRGTLIGKYDNSSFDIIGVQYNHRF